MVTVGVDIGGSGVRAASIKDGWMGPMHVHDGAHESTDALIRTVEQVVGRCGSAGGVGVGIPGFVRDGVVLGSPNLPFLNGQPIEATLRERLGVPVHLINDANAAALGAWVDLKDPGDLLVLTLGTGVGGGIIMGGRVWSGGTGTAGELGHIHIGGPVPCGCGAVGCLETWLGAAGLARRAAARGHLIDSVTALVAAADDGHVWAQQLLHEAANALGYGLRTLLNVLGIRRVLITGGVAGAESWLRPGAEAVVLGQGIQSNVQDVRFTWRASASSWAICGAARHALAVG